MRFCSILTIIQVFFTLNLSFCLDATGETILFGTGNNEFTIEFVEIGDPGNLDDAEETSSAVSGGEVDNSTARIGGVDYVFYMAKFEISRDIVAKANSELRRLGISLHSAHEQANGDVPATGISWIEARDFTNWLNLSKAYQVPYRSSPATWSVDEPGYDASNAMRNSQARFVLPTADEWHKAAYYDPLIQDYWDYPTGSNDPPDAVASGIEIGTAVFEQANDSLPAEVNSAGALSPYGIMGLGGNVVEWEESFFDLVTSDVTDSGHRAIRGGSWKSDARNMASFRRGRESIGAGGSSNGFRVVMLLPEFDFGDFNRDGLFTDADIDLLSTALRDVSTDGSFDINEDGLVNDADRIVWISEIANTSPGDADLDGEVAFNDFLALANSFDQPGGWANGDFDGNGLVEFVDFLALADNFGQAEAASVPEPRSFALALGFAVVMLVRRRG